MPLDRQFAIACTVLAAFPLGTAAQVDAFVAAADVRAHGLGELDRGFGVPIFEERSVLGDRMPFPSAELFLPVGPATIPEPGVVATVLVEGELESPAIEPIQRLTADVGVEIDQLFDPIEPPYLRRCESGWSHAVAIVVFNTITLELDVRTTPPASQPGVELRDLIPASVLDADGTVLLEGPPVPGQLSYRTSIMLGPGVYSLESSGTLASSTEGTPGLDATAAHTIEFTFTAGCRADLDGDGVLTLFDFLVFQDEFGIGRTLIADWDRDGELTVFDFLGYLNDFSAGCP
ncbi:MAG: GC-type dockerin domain-anchored protein [Phycisphaerales bacterium]|jgi:hypothetical protein